MKRMSIVSAIVCMSVFMGTSYHSVAQNDTPTTMNASHDDDQDDNGKWGLAGLLGLLGLLGLKRREATDHTTTRTTTGTRTDR
jgi:MYXO-CTERM domain-containing protein